VERYLTEIYNNLDDIVVGIEIASISYFNNYNFYKIYYFIKIKMCINFLLILLKCEGILVTQEYITLSLNILLIKNLKKLRLKLENC